MRYALNQPNRWQMGECRAIRTKSHLIQFDLPFKLRARIIVESGAPPPVGGRLLPPLHLGRKQSTKWDVVSPNAVACPVTFRGHELSRLWVGTSQCTSASSAAFVRRLELSRPSLPVALD
jgi:hypothetical protein